MAARQKKDLRAQQTEKEQTERQKEVWGAGIRAGGSQGLALKSAGKFTGVEGSNCMSGVLVHEMCFSTD